MNESMKKSIRPATSEGQVRVSRRGFVKSASASGVGLWVGAQLGTSIVVSAGASGAAIAASTSNAATVANFGAYLEIDAAGSIYITCPQSEMGQGVHDGLTRIVADELGADWADVVVRLAHASEAFVNPISKRHRTASSESTQIYFELLRKVGATAREMLRAAAAARWSVAADSCRVENSAVVHLPSSRRLRFGELAAAAAALPVPQEVTLKRPEEFALIGKVIPSKSTPAKLDGSAVFGIDVRLPGMAYAVLHRSPVVGAKLIDFDREAVLALPGVIAAFAVPDGVAVVARSTWQAREAAAAVEARFDTRGHETLNSEGMRERMLRALDADQAALGARGTPEKPGDAAATRAAIESAPLKGEWVYEVPFLAHAALEPLCATAVVHEDRAEVWAPTQQPDRAWDAVAEITGLPKDRCRLNVTLLGGGFGRKWENDFVRQAVQVAKEMRGTPIKLMWTREQDFQHDKFRPAHIVRTRAGFDRDGRILGMHSRTTGISMWKYQGRRAIPGMPDLFAVGMLINSRYDFPNQYIDYVETPEPIPVGTWRSVSQSMNGFFSESAIDDVAAASGQDPLALRLSLCSKDPRADHVLREVARLAEWNKPLPKGWGRGIALSLGYDSYCAEVVEVSMVGKRVKIERIVAVFDCGFMVDPRSVEAQVEGGIIWGLSAALDGQIRFEGGAAMETNFHTSPILRLDQTPKIEVHVLKTNHPSGGAGEASVPGIAPALAGAIHAASGERPRRLPLIEAGYEFV